MLSHITKLIWNRKQANSLIIAEVAITFVVLFAIISTAIHNYQSFYKPLGFEWKDTWSIEINMGGRFNKEKDEGRFKELIRVLRQRPEFNSVDMSMIPVFQNWTHSSDDKVNGKNIYHLINTVNAEGPKNWGVELVAGRWFGVEDSGQNYNAIMINELFANQAFDEEDPIGFEFSNPDRPENLPQRIVGVFKDFRQKGEFSAARPYMFKHYVLDDDYMNFIHLKFKEVKSADYEETLLKTLKSVAPNWEFKIKSWAAQREQHIDEVVVPLLVLSVVVGFLLLMVAMGLFGVLFQNISRRTREIGLRRAIGASKSAIRTQIIGELIVVALFGIAISFIILVQIPLLQMIESITWQNFWLSLTASVSVIMLMVILCALYPSRAAIMLEPAHALHYE